MKELVLTPLVSLGVILIVGVTAFFPYGLIYDITLGIMTDIGHKILEHGLVFTSADTNNLRFGLTLLFAVFTAFLIGCTLLLRKASKLLELNLFVKILTGITYYVGGVTFLMILGIWLDFTLKVARLGVLARVGFFFYDGFYYIM
ncbi:hypothetical protein JXM67_15110 [candidate division WOR-3 bacterium]|nr:hypothetical protein [candidate division WOR-3 bacterium]